MSIIDPQGEDMQLSFIAGGEMLMVIWLWCHALFSCRLGFQNSASL